LVVDGGMDFGVGEEGNDVLEVEHLAAKLVGLGVDEDELIDGLHVCTYRAFFKSLNFYLHLPTHNQDLEPVRSMVASRAAGVASSGRREWPSVRGGQWAGARTRRRHLDRQGRPRSASELWEDRSNLSVGAERGERCQFRGAVSDLVFSGGREILRWTREE
jgi:hypothetical protein